MTTVLPNLLSLTQHLFSVTSSPSASALGFGCDSNVCAHPTNTPLVLLSINDLICDKLSSLSPALSPETVAAKGAPSFSHLAGLTQFHGNVSARASRNGCHGYLRLGSHVPPPPMAWLLVPVQNIPNQLRPLHTFPTKYRHP